MKRSGRLLVLWCLLLCAGLSSAQDYPNKPIRLIVPFPAGGGTSVMAKAFADRLGADLGQTVTVENQGGRFGATGSEAAAKSAPDGYTLLLATTSSFAIAPAGVANIAYNPSKDFTAVDLIGEVPFVLLVSPKSEARSLAELIALAKARPGELKFGSPGAASLSHLIAAYFITTAGIDVKPAEHRPSTRIYSALASGDIDLYFDSIVSAATEIGRGRARGLGVLGSRGSSVLSELPVIQQQFPQFDATQWLGVVGPAGLPPAVVQRLHASMTKVLRETEMKEKLAAIGAEVIESNPAAFQKLLEQDPAAWRDIIQATGIKLPQ